MREKMVSEQILSRGIRDEHLLRALREIPRHRFVPYSLRHRAYEDGPLPIGEEQTISQPYIVAEMTEALSLEGTEKVLEIGTGSGYQTAILCRLAREVVTTERIDLLSRSARRVLEDLGIRNLRFRIGDGTLGCPEEAPFDAILVTAAAPEIPPPLLSQLTVGGILVIPVGGRWEQDLVRLRKEEGGSTKEILGGCRFVPLLGEYGFPS
jgi:protein-L-isoaspartate(D-aspartate) O-methyltransferase